MVNELNLAVVHFTHQNVHQNPMQICACAWIYRWTKNYGKSILIPRAYDPSGLRQESRAVGAIISGADYVRPDNQNSVISFVISKWLLPELSIPAAGQKNRRLWG